MKKLEFDEMRIWQCGIHVGLSEKLLMMTNLTFIKRENLMMKHGQILSKDKGNKNDRI